MEMALITPILLLLVLGVFQVGLAMLTQLELQHAAQQAAIAGAAAEDRCEKALETVPLIYGSTPDAAECAEPPGIIRVTVTDGAPIIGPWGIWNIEAIGRAVAPKEPDGL